MSAGGEGGGIPAISPASDAAGPTAEPLSRAYPPPTGKPVWIIDPQTLFRRGLCLLLRQWYPGLAVLDAADTAAALAALPPDPGMALVDAEMACRSRFAGLAQLSARLPATPLVLLGTGIEWRTAVRAVELGARGYVPKSASEAVFRHALGLVASGEVYLPKEILTRFSANSSPRHRLPGASPSRSAEPRLTRRQREVLEQIALGLSNKEIARALGLLEGTVKVHVKTILRKLAASNRTHAALLAREMGFADRSQESYPERDRPISFEG